MDYLSQLNPQQRRAVEYTDGPALVIAGAGSGKTRVLTYKIVHLLNQGYEPYRILALTFTNKAAREMKERVASVLGEHTAGRLRMGTFHSVFLYILRQHSDLLGFKRNFTIYDTSDSRSLIKTIVRDMQLDDKQYKPATIAGVISNAKNALVLPQQYMADADYTRADKNAKRPMTGVIYQRYVERCRLADAMDFDDILLYMNLLLRDHPEIRRHYQQFFRYILVDEYQDTNFAQHMIITQLAGEEQNICVVGDDAQSIYSFRGANISNILNLKRFYPRLEIFKLERNYRSTKNIIGAANSLIAANSRQIPKNIYSENEEGSRVECIQCYSDIEESAVVATHISQSKLTYHDSLDDYAILYRTNAQSRLLEEALRKRNIPYRVYGGLSFFQRKEVKDAMSYFRLAVNQNDDEALKRIINYPARGIGGTTLSKLTVAATQSGASLWEVLCRPEEYGVKINSGTRNKLQGFENMIRCFAAEIDKGSNAYEVAMLVYQRVGLISVLAHDDTPESISQKENLEELLRTIEEFVKRDEDGPAEQRDTMQEYLSQVSLATDQDEKEGDDKPKVTLMTVHAAKGLEYGNVYVAGVEEGLFPSSMAMDSWREVEEERRLLYVAITRAKHRCTLTYCRTRFRHGKEEWPRPSRFLMDIDLKYISSNNSGNISSYNAIRPGVRQAFNPRMTRGGDSITGAVATATDGLRTNSRRRLSATVGGTACGETVQEISLPQGLVQVGSRIEHNLFGEGTVVKIEKSGSGASDATLHVEFDTAGMKRLLSRFAKFELI